MHYDLLIFLPAAACLFWMIILILMASRTSTFHPLLIGLAVMTLYIYTDSSFSSPNTPYRTLAFTDIIAQFVAPSMLPLIWLYLMRLRGQRHFRAEQMLWLIFPAALGATAITLTLIAGPERIVEFQTKVYSGTITQAEIQSSRVLQAYNILLGPIFRVVLLGEALVYSMLMLSLILRENFRFRHLGKFLKGGKLRVLELQVYLIISLAFIFVPKMVLQHETLMEHPWITVVLNILMTIGISLFCYNSLFGAKDKISITDIKRGFTYNYRKENQNETLEQTITNLISDVDSETLRLINAQIRQNLNIHDAAPGEQQPAGMPVPGATTPSLARGIYAAVAKSWNDEGLLARFEQLMIRKQSFLEPGLTLAEVSDRLNSNKTYVSRMINNTYNMAFPDLVNTLRVDYAEKYILAHRDARQQEIAEASGFASASSFNNVFKKITGMTPKIWLAAYDQQNLLAEEPTAVMS